MYEVQAKYLEAEGLYEHYYELCQRLHGCDAPETIRAMNKRAEMCYRAGNYTSALTMSMQYEGMLWARKERIFQLDLLMHSVLLPAWCCCVPFHVAHTHCCLRDGCNFMQAPVVCAVCFILTFSPCLVAGYAIESVCCLHSSPTAGIGSTVIPLPLTESTTSQRHAEPNADKPGTILMMDG